MTYVTAVMAVIIPMVFFYERGSGVGNIKRNAHSEIVNSKRI